MKSRFINISKKSAATLLAIVVMLSLLLTGCGVEELLQDLATDYVLIDIANTNGTLLSESENNEQIYTYQIDANVTNGYALDLTNAVITLNVPDNVEISSDGDKVSIKEKNITVSDTMAYSWIVKIPMTYEDQNIEYRVSVVSDVSSTVEAYGLLWVDGKNKNDNRLDFDIDTWKFENYGQKPIPLLQEDYNALVIGFSNANRESLKKIIKDNSSGGFCYGMATTCILTKIGRLTVSNIDSSASNLHSISKTDKAKSVIGYYWINQFFTAVQDEKAQFLSKTTEEKLSIIEEKAKAVESGGNPFIFSFATKVDGTGGHAVVGYSHENGSFKWNGKKYDSRILIYDNNYPKWNEKSCLYYNKGTSDWYIPNYPNSSAITRALSDLNIMDLKNIEANTKSVNSYVTARGNEQLNIYAADGTLLATVDGVNAEGSKGILAFRNDGSDDALMIAIPKSGSNNTVEDAYVFESIGNNQELDLSIQYDNYYLSASGQNQESIAFNPNGNVEIKGTTSDFDIEITANEGYYSTEWYKISVAGESGTSPGVEITDGGYIFSGEDLSDITVYAENATTANELTLKTEETQVFITQEGENLCVKSDEDKDGQYETILVTGTTTTPDDPTSGGSRSGFKFGGSSGSVNLWVILLIAGVLLISVIITVIIVAFRSKNKKNNDEFEVPVINSDCKKLNEEPVVQGLIEPFGDKFISEDPISVLNGIRVLTGNMAEQEFEIVDGQTVTVGKDPKLANILLDVSYNLVSRIHCTVTYSAKFDKYFVIDCSLNGTYFENGTRLTKNTRTPVTRGSVLKLADDSCLIRFI